MACSALWKTQCASGIDGLIVPDLPPEEAHELEAACRAAGLATIYLLAPTSTEERIRLVAQHATGFIYLVSVTGITGARTELPPDLAAFVARVRRADATCRWRWDLALPRARKPPPWPRSPMG